MIGTKKNDVDYMTPCVFFLTGEWSALSDMLEKSGKIGGQPDLYLPWLRYRERGYEVHVFYLGNFKQEKIVDFHGCNIHLVKRPSFFEYRNKQKYLRLRFPADCVFLYNYAKKIGDKIRPKIIYANQPWLSYTTWALGWRYGSLTVKHIFGTWLYYDWVYSRNIKRKILCLPHFLAWKVPADFFFIMNDGTEGDKLASLLRIPSEKVYFWINGVEKKWGTEFAEKIELRRKYLLEKDHFVLMNISRLSPWKRQDRIIKAMPAILAEVPNARLMLVGGGRSEEKLRKLVDKLELEDKVIFAGHIPHSNVQEYLSTADIYLQTNDLSCLGNTLLEALVCGKAIVTWNVGKTSDVITDNVNGRLLTDAKPTTIAKAVIELAHDRKKMNRLAKGARIFAEEELLTWDERIDSEIDLIEKAYIDRHGQLIDKKIEHS